MERGRKEFVEGLLLSWATGLAQAKSGPYTAWDSPFKLKEPA